MDLKRRYRNSLNELNNSSVFNTRSYSIVGLFSLLNIIGITPLSLSWVELLRELMSAGMDEGACSWKCRLLLLARLTLETIVCISVLYRVARLSSELVVVGWELGATLVLLAT